MILIDKETQTVLSRDAIPDVMGDDDTKVEECPLTHWKTLLDEFKSTNNKDSTSAESAADDDDDKSKPTSNDDGPKAEDDNEREAKKQKVEE